tara:strand:+ start:616 stop:750 length:135 start_codon:yes stop_codon:yes gene_type:complete
MSEKDEIIRLINDLEWDFQRMSRGGQETMIELQKLLGMPINKEK